MRFTEATIVAFIAAGGLAMAQPQHLQELAARDAHANAEASLFSLAAKYAPKIGSTLYKDAVKYGPGIGQAVFHEAPNYISSIGGVINGARKKQKRDAYINADPRFGWKTIKKVAGIGAQVGCAVGTFVPGVDVAVDAACLGSEAINAIRKYHKRSPDAYAEAFPEAYAIALANPAIYDMVFDQ
jgi:hypothetical protein